MKSLNFGDSHSGGFYDVFELDGCQRVEARKLISRKKPTFKISALY
jgi:hypothetical protein